MCFSALASFVTAGLTGAVGAATLTRVNHPRELPLAATPIFFALQQGVEGALWLTLTAESERATINGLTFLFLLFAQVLWPVYAPLAVWLVEPSQQRRRLMAPWLAIGVSVSGYLLWGLLTRTPSAQIMDGHITYATGQQHSTIVALGYLAATGLPLMLSSRRTVLALGVIVLVGSATAYFFYSHAFQSVWCYFAAAGSVVLLCHFHLVRRPRILVAPA